jgi:hypothetical protein
MLVESVALTKTSGGPWWVDRDGGGDEAALQNPSNVLEGLDRSAGPQWLTFAAGLLSLGTDSSAEWKGHPLALTNCGRGTIPGPLRKDSHCPLLDDECGMAFCLAEP